MGEEGAVRAEPPGPSCAGPGGQAGGAWHRCPLALLCPLLTELLWETCGGSWAAGHLVPYGPILSRVRAVKPRAKSGPRSRAPGTLSTAAPAHVGRPAHGRARRCCRRVCAPPRTLPSGVPRQVAVHSHLCLKNRGVFLCAPESPLGARGLAFGEGPRAPLPPPGRVPALLPPGRLMLSPLLPLCSPRSEQPGLGSLVRASLGDSASF